MTLTGEAGLLTLTHVPDDHDQETPFVEGYSLLVSILKFLQDEVDGLFDQYLPGFDLDLRGMQQFGLLATNYLFVHQAMPTETGKRTQRMGG